MNFPYGNLVFLQRLTQGIMGLLTLFFVAKYLSFEQQGWYYTFSSIAAVYTIFDLGLSVVLVQLAAHAFVSLGWNQSGRIVGDFNNQFKSLLQSSIFFYSCLAVLYILIVLPFGFFLFLHKEPLSENWFLPWLSLVTFTGLNILSLPYIALVEGSGRVNEVYCLRIFQNFFGAICLWVALILGYNLWALSILPSIAFGFALMWLILFKPSLLKDSFYKNTRTFIWKKEVWPLQWRVGLSWLSGYLLTQIYTPILFHFNSPKVAGQMGLSLTIANMLGLLAQSWITHRLPDLGKSVASKNWVQFDQIFKQDFKFSLLFYFLGCIFLCLVIFVINNQTNYGERLLPFFTFIALLIVVLINHINGALNAHLRSFKKEPLVFISLISTFITIPIALYGAINFSAIGVVFAILFVQILFTLPTTIYFWIKYNREWRIE